jgi:hypothetical protein
LMETAQAVREKTYRPVPVRRATGKHPQGRRSFSTTRHTYCAGSCCPGRR